MTQKTLWSVVLFNLMTQATYAFPVFNYSYLRIANNAESLYIPATTTVNVLNSGWTALSGGQLAVDGIVNGMTVDITGGVLSGTGTVNMWGLVANERGMVMPGNGIQSGHLTINSDYVQSAGGTLLINIDAAGASQLSVSGAASLNGALRGAGLNGFVPVQGTHYTILTANAVLGAFTGIPAYITPVLFLDPQYTSHAVNVTVTRNYLNPFLLADLSRNQTRVLSTLNNLSQRVFPAGSDFNTVLNAFDALPSNNAVANALTAMEPIGTDTLLNIAVSDMTYRAALLNQNLTPIAPCFNAYHAGNMNLFVAGNLYDGNATDGLEKNRYDLRGQGEVLGVSYALNSQAALGLLLQWNQAQAHLYTGSTVDEHSTLFAPYFLYQNEKWYANALMGYSSNAYHLNRNIVFGSINRVASARPDGNEWVAYLSAGYDLMHTTPWSIGPDVALQYVNLAIPNYTEQGANSLDLNVASQTANSLRSNFGGHIFYHLLAGEQQFIPMLSAAYVHEFANQSNMNFAFVQAANTNTSLNLQTTQRNFLLMNAGFELNGEKAWRIILNYTAQVDSSHWINGVMAEGRWAIA